MFLVNYFFGSFFKQNLMNESLESKDTPPNDHFSNNIAEIIPKIHMAKSFKLEDECLCPDLISYKIRKMPKNVLSEKTSNSFHFEPLHKAVDEEDKEEQKQSSPKHEIKFYFNKAEPILTSPSKTIQKTEKRTIQSVVKKKQIKKIHVEPAEIKNTQKEKEKEVKKIHVIDKQVIHAENNIQKDPDINKIEVIDKKVILSEKIFSNDQQDMKKNQIINKIENSSGNPLSLPQNPLQIPPIVGPQNTLPILQNPQSMFQMTQNPPPTNVIAFTHNEQNLFQIASNSTRIPQNPPQLFQNLQNLQNPQNPQNPQRIPENLQRIPQIQPELPSNQSQIQVPQNQQNQSHIRLINNYYDQINNRISPMQKDDIEGCIKKGIGQVYGFTRLRLFETAEEFIKIYEKYKNSEETAIFFVRQLVRITLDNQVDFYFSQSESKETMHDRIGRIAILFHLINLRCPGILDFLIEILTEVVQPGRSKKSYFQRKEYYSYFYFCVICLDLKVLFSVNAIRDIENTLIRENRDSPNFNRTYHEFQETKNKLVIYLSRNISTNYNEHYWKFLENFFKKPIEETSVIMCISFCHASYFIWLKEGDKILKIIEKIKNSYLPKLQAFHEQIRNQTDKNTFRLNKQKLEDIIGDITRMKMIPPFEERKEE